MSVFEASGLCAMDTEERPTYDGEASASWVIECPMQTTGGMLMRI